MDARTRASASIARAQIELDRAIGEIDLIESLDAGVVAVVAHALHNYITVTAATVEMLQLVLRDHEDGDVTVWLKGISHATDMMMHSVGRLVASSPPRDFQMTLDCINVPLMMERACEYYRRHRAGDNIQFVCESVGDPPLAWGDRVALAVVAENLLANAVRVTAPNGVIHVEVAGEPGHVVAIVRDPGPELTYEQQQEIFRSPGPGMSAGTGVEPRVRLALAYEFIQRMDGELWCDSRPGHRVSFSFRLPAVE